MEPATGRRVVLITGAAGALGSELAFTAALAGWETVLTDRSLRLLDPVCDRIASATGSEPIVQPLDLSLLDPAQCTEIVHALKSGPGRLDALVHCAASFDGLRPFRQVDPADWLYDLQVNLHAPWLLSSQCLELLLQAPRASLFFLVDDVERMAGAFWGAYGVSKRAVDALAAQLATELRNTGVRVLAIDPGPLRSPLRARAYHAEDPSRVKPASHAAQKILGFLDEFEGTDSHRVTLFA